MKKRTTCMKVNATQVKGISKEEQNHFKELDRREKARCVAIKDAYKYICSCTSDEESIDYAKELTAKIVEHSKVIRHYDDAYAEITYMYTLLIELMMEVSFVNSRS
jgi:hypothetical protein